MIKKITLLAVMIGFLVACNCQASQQKNQKEEFVLQQGDTLFYENGDFRVVGQEKEAYTGYTFRIYDRKTAQSFEYGGGETDALWYLSVYDTCLLLDAGTGAQYRAFVVVDMKNGKERHRQNYVAYEGVGIQGNTFIYWVQIDALPDGVAPPDCPQIEGIPDEQFGYVEKWAFDFNTMKSKSLKEYECIYFE